MNKETWVQDAHQAGMHNPGRKRTPYKPGPPMGRTQPPTTLCIHA